MKRNNALLLIATFCGVTLVLVYLAEHRQRGGLEPLAVPPADQSASRTAADPARPGGARQAGQQTPRAVRIEPGDDGTVSASPPEAGQGAPALEPEIRGALEELLNTSSEGLVEEDMSGSVGVNLQGRFRTAPVATINEKGEVEITDYSHLPQ